MTIKNPFYGIYIDKDKRDNWDIFIKKPIRNKEHKTLGVLRYEKCRQNDKLVCKSFDKFYKKYPNDFEKLKQELIRLQKKLGDDFYVPVSTWEIDDYLKNYRV